MPRIAAPLLIPIVALLMAGGLLSACEQKASPQPAQPKMPPAPSSAQPAPDSEAAPGAESDGAIPPAAPNPPAAAAPPAPAPAQNPAAGAALYNARCALCHGPRGEGNGPAAAAIRVKLQSLRDPAWEAQVTDEYLRKIITGGGPAVGKHAAMPAAPDLARDPRLPDLIAHIRALKD